MEANDGLFDISLLSLEGEFSHQVQEILKHVRLTKQEVEDLQLLFNDLQKALTHIWPGCIVKAFGSIVTGLGIKSSDIDCYVVLPRWTSPTRECVMHTRNVLRKRHSIFQKVFAIVGAKVPIVKFFHVPTQTNCDVNFNSPNGVANSSLLAGLIHMDKRVLPLAVLIKYWSKIQKLTGTNLMPSYCLTLLVIFYLQQCNILPSVLQLQRNAPQEFIDNWNVGFVIGHYTTRNKESLYQLLGGFFKYYSTFAFSKYVVSPFIGRVITKELYSNVELVSDDFYLYKHNIRNKICEPIRFTPLMCVQDPFDHSRNCAVGVNVKFAHIVMDQFKRACAIFDRETENNFLRKILASNVLILPKKPKRRRVQVARGVRKTYRPQKTDHKQNIEKAGQMVFRKS